MRFRIADDRQEEGWAWLALIATRWRVTAIVFLITGAKCLGLGVATTLCAAIIGLSVVLLVLAHAQSLAAD